MLGCLKRKLLFYQWLFQDFSQVLAVDLFISEEQVEPLSTAEVTLPEGFNGIPVALLGMNSPLGVF